MFHLTGFQKDCLFTIAARGRCSSDRIRDRLQQCYRSVPRHDVEDAVSALTEKGYLTRTDDGANTAILYSLTETAERQLDGGLFTQIALEGPKNGLLNVTNMVYHNLPPELVISIRKWTNSIRHQASPDPMQRLWIDPDRIKRRMDIRAFSNRNDRGKVARGEWDTITTTVRDHPIYWGLEDRFENEMPWRETAYFRWGKLRIEGSGAAFGCTTPEQFLTERCAYIDRLYDEIRSNGYQTQEQADLTFARRRHQASTEITANVGRDGELLLYDGHHRLAIAKILDLETVPIELVVRHREWQHVRDSVIESVMDRSSQKREVSQVDHPDLWDLVDI